MASSGLLTTITTAFGACRFDLLTNACDNFGIRAEQVITTHARFAGNARGNDDDVAVDGVVIGSRADDI